MMSVTDSRLRFDSVDLLRGVVMVIMALDHTRDFFSNVSYDPLNLARTDEALFLTRWITHFCAPVFVFLAGAGAYFRHAHGKTKAQTAGFLFTRGLWLVFLELTVIHFGWYFNLDFRYELAQVIWAIGWSMAALAALVFLPVWAVALVGVGMIAGHNLLDGVRPAQFGDWSWLWTVLHQRGTIRLSRDAEIFILYPLVPWIGVMAAGYGFGALFSLKDSRRPALFLIVGVALTLIFIALRATNLYGDPRPWSPQKNLMFTIFSFINCEKYPPSLLFLLMTLGPAIMALAWFERLNGWLARFFIAFGRAPLFYYVTHLLLIHALAVVVAFARYGRAGWLLENAFRSVGAPRDYGYDLLGVYLVWLIVVLMLYPLCRWFAGVKARRRDAWLSYL